MSAWRGGSGRVFLSSYWRERWLLSAFYIPGLPGGARSADFFFFFFPPFGLKEGRASAKPLRARAPVRAPRRSSRSAAERRSCSSSCRRPLAPRGRRRVAGSPGRPSFVRVRDGMWAPRRSFLSGWNSGACGPTGSHGLRA